jgi:hypothetical protein
MSTTPLLPAVVTTIDDDGGQRISDRPYRLMYVTKTIADTVDRSQLRPDSAPPSAGRTTRRPTVARTHRRPVCEGGEPMKPSNEPRRYQTNASLSQPATAGADRPVREYVTNVSWRANQ